MALNLYHQWGPLILSFKNYSCHKHPKALAYKYSNNKISGDPTSEEIKYRLTGTEDENFANSSNNHRHKKIMTTMNTM